MKTTMLTLENIEEIKFTKVGNNTFSLTIKSDIDLNKKKLKNTVFEAQLCKIDSRLELKMEKEYTDVQIYNDYFVRSEYFNIPINIRLLLNKELNQFFSITKE